MEAWMYTDACEGTLYQWIDAKVAVLAADPSQEPVVANAFYDQLYRILHGVVSKMHREGIIHNDLHAGNIMYVPVTTPHKEAILIWKVIDFGRAYVAEPFRAVTYGTWLRDMGVVASPDFLQKQSKDDFERELTGLVDALWTGGGMLSLDVLLRDRRVDSMIAALKYWLGNEHQNTYFNDRGQGPMYDQYGPILDLYLLSQRIHLDNPSTYTMVNTQVEGAKRLKGE
jgi:serine/threonine protein kinase